VTSIAESPNEKSLAVGRDDGSVGLMSLRTGRTRLLGRHAPLGGIWSAQFTPGGRWLITTSADHTSIVWDVRSGTQVEVLSGQSDIVTQQALSPDTETLYTGSADGTIVKWDVGGRHRLGRTVAFTAGYPADIYSHPQPTAAAVSPDGRVLALSRNDAVVQLWSTRTLRPVGGPFRGFSERDTTTSGGAEDLAFSPDGKLLAAGGGAGSPVVVWNVANHEIVYKFTPPPTPEPHGNGLQFSPDGRTLADGDGGFGALLWNLATRHAERLFDGRNHYVLSLAYSPDGMRLATVDNALPINRGRLWDVSHQPARRIAVFPADQGQGLAASVAFSPNGRLLATGASGVITLRDSQTGRLVRTLPIPNGYNGALAFSPDGSKLAVLARDGAEVWDIDTGTEIGTGLPGASPQRGTPGGPGRLLYTPDGRLVMVSPNGLATIWNVNPAAWDAAACRIAGRQLTPAEWARFVGTEPYSSVCP
jgi:WD40 repeat protein